MICIFVEPQAAFNQRMHILPAPIPSAMTAREIMARSMPDQLMQRSSKGPQQELIMEILRFEGDVPVRITELVNRSATWATHDSRSDREKAKLAYFRLIGEMIRAGKLKRIARNYVLAATQERTAPERGRQLDPIELPAPLV